MLFETKNISLDVTEEDLTDLANGCVDYIGFSYYMSFAVKGAEKALLLTTMKQKTWCEILM